MIVGINGFGRIGRVLYRVNMQNDYYFDMPIINDINPDAANIAYQLNYDTTYGALTDKFSTYGDTLSNHITSFQAANQERIDEFDWDKYGVEIVVDASGKKKIFCVLCVLGVLLKRMPLLNKGRRWGRTDFQALKDLEQRLDKLEKTDFDRFCQQTAKELAGQILTQAKKRTIAGVVPDYATEEAKQQYWAKYTRGTLQDAWTVLPLES